MADIKKKYLKKFSEKNNLFHLFLVASLLGFCFYKTYSIHLDYPFPYHHDEWQHLGISVQAMDLGYNAKYNPFLGKEHWHFDLESGFHLFISLFFMITGLNPVLSYQFFAAVFSAITGLAIFYCVYRLSNKFEIGFLSLAVFASLKSNINILGKDYFVPMTMALPFMFLFIYYFVGSLSRNNFKEFLFSLIILVFVLLIHPPTFIILLVPSLIELISNPKFIKKNFKKIAIAFTIGFSFLALLSFIFLWKGKLGSSLEYLLDLIVFEKGWGKVEITYFIPLLFGMANTLFSIYGFMKAYNSRLRIFIYLAALSLGISTFFNSHNYSIIIPYQRAVHYAMLGLMPLAAAGLYYFSESALKTASKIINKKTPNIKLSRIIKYSIYIVFFIAIITPKYAVDEQYKRYSFPVITKQGYEALIWISSNYGSNNTIITPYFMTSAVYPVSRNRAISLIPSQMGGGLIKENQEFFKYGCKKKSEIINKSKAGFVLTGKKIDCSDFKQVFYNGIYVYRVG